jgi:two-component system nitrogen regulation response regulator GlnG
LVLASDNILSETHSPDAAMPAPRAQTVSTHACSTDIVGASASMRELLITIERLAASDVTVLIEGETGVGKELVAEAIHARSPRGERPFVVCDLGVGAINPALLHNELFGCGAVAASERDRQGAFSLAEHSTLFLDEIGELDAASQPLLLRALERKQIKPVGAEIYQAVDVRIIASTKHDLLSDVTEGRFRRDLYHRLMVVRLYVPPLRERAEDVPALVDFFLRAACAARGTAVPTLSERALRALCDYDWPGNVRELRNLIERAISLAPEATELDIGLLGLPAEPRAVARGSEMPSLGELIPFKDAKDRLVDRWERQYLIELLGLSQGNVSQAAKHAGLARGHLHRLLRKHRLTRSDNSDNHDSSRA